LGYFAVKAIYSGTSLHSGPWEESIVRVEPELNLFEQLNEETFQSIKRDQEEFSQKWRTKRACSKSNNPHPPQGRVLRLYSHSLSDMTDGSYGLTGSFFLALCMHAEY